MRKLAASIILALIPFLILIGIILVIAGLISMRKSNEENNNKESGEEMIKNVYVYLVLFATLMMTIGGSVSVFMATADIIAPTPYYQSYEDFVRWNTEIKDVDGEIKKEELSQEELQEKYAALVKSETERQMMRAKNTLIKSFGWIVIPLPVFIYFQRRLVKKLV